MAAKITPEARVAEYFRTAPLERILTMFEVVRTMVRSRRETETVTVVTKSNVVKTRQKRKSPTVNSTAQAGKDKAPLEEQTKLAGVASHSAD